VAIAGLGLMGGSLALALRAATAPRSESGTPAAWPPGGASLRLVGVDSNAASLRAAEASEAIDMGSDDLGLAVSVADVVVLAVPVRSILDLLPQVGEHARPGTLVLDLGSTKVAICAAMAELPDDLRPVGGHPMCGTEQAGFAAARADLYGDRPFVLCPLPRSGGAALDEAAGLVAAAGARPVLADPAAHDAAVAAISHLPYAAAAALVRTVDGAGDPLAWALAASGFRDTTRVAAGNVDVMLDALLTNRDAVLASLDAFGGYLELLRTALAGGDETRLRAELAAARSRRAGM
jgi:prephenate dehydrogenase